MGKASRWFRGLLGLNKPADSSSPSPKQQHQQPPPLHRVKRRWSFVKSRRDRDRDGHSQRSPTYDPDGSVDPERHAIAVAAATAAVAEAAVAAANAAAAVVRLTSSGRCCSAPYGREEWAALKIQSAFRGYLARRALRALKGLVKIQALVRGHIERKRTTKKVLQMQAVLRVQARARAERGQMSESSQSSSVSSHFHHPGPTTPEKSEHSGRVKSIKHDQSPILGRNGSKSSGRANSYQDRVHFGRNGSEHRIDEGLLDQQRGSSTRMHPAEEEYSDKILEVDMIKPLYTPKRKNLLPSIAHHQMEPNPSPSSGEVQSSLYSLKLTHEIEESPFCTADNSPLYSLKLTHEIEESPFCTADNSPQVYSASSRGGSRRSPFTPTKSDGSRSFLSGYSDHPNYMAYTESSRAKARSLSAPKQRPHFEKSGSTKRYSVQGFGESRPTSQVSSSLQANFVSKAYPGSGRLDRLGMPIVRGVGGSGYRYYN